MTNYICVFNNLFAKVTSILYTNTTYFLDLVHSSPSEAGALPYI